MLCDLSLTLMLGGVRRNTLGTRIVGCRLFLLRVRVCISFWPNRCTCRQSCVLAVIEPDTSKCNIFIIAISVRISNMSAVDAWMAQRRRISRRFTTLEGWREVGNGIYLTGSSLRIFTAGTQFDSEAYHDDRTSWTRPSKHARSSAISPPWSLTPDGATEVQARPLEDRHSQFRPLEAEAEVYHIFNNKQKWGVVVIIGIAGLFSGLSSNIFFPSLDAISKASSHLFRL